MPDTARFQLKSAGGIPARPESRKAVMAYRLLRLSRRLAWVSLAFSATLSAGCSTPVHLSDSHVTSAPWSPALDVAGLVCQPVAALGPVAAPGIQGLSATVSYALTSALSQASPPIRTIPSWIRISGYGELASPRKTQPREPGGPPAWLLERPYLRVPAAEVRP